MDEINKRSEVDPDAPAAGVRQVVEEAVLRGARCPPAEVLAAFADDVQEGRIDPMDLKSLAGEAQSIAVHLAWCQACRADFEGLNVFVSPTAETAEHPALYLKVPGRPDEKVELFGLRDDALYYVIRVPPGEFRLLAHWGRRRVELHAGTAPAMSWQPEREMLMAGAKDLPEPAAWLAPMAGQFAKGRIRGGFTPRADGVSLCVVIDPEEVLEEPD